MEKFLDARLVNKGRRLQEELDVCKLCMLMNYHKQREKNPNLDKWQHWTTAVQQVEAMDKEQHKKEVQRLALGQVALRLVCCGSKLGFVADYKFI
jgi:hypothetical protein